VLNLNIIVQVGICISGHNSIINCLNIILHETFIYSANLILMGEFALVHI